MRKVFAIAVVAGVMLAALAGPGGAQVERPRLTLAVGGQPLYIYLPLTLAAQLGYFKQAGVDVNIVDLAGGAKALEALLGGSADVVCGFIDHTIEMQAQGKAIRMFVLYDRYPGLVLAVTRAGQARGIKAIADLKGARIGVTAPGRLYATPSFLERNPKTALALALASVRALHWIKTHSAGEIANRMPEQFYQSDKGLYVASLRENLEMFSPDGRVPLSGLQTIVKVLSAFDRSVVANAGRINPQAAFTNEFVEEAHRTLKF